MALSRKEKDRCMERLNKIRKEERLIMSVLERHNVGVIIWKGKAVLAEDWVREQREQ